MTIAGLYIFNPKDVPQFDAIKSIFETMVEKNPRFRTTPERKGGICVWEICPDFNILDHVKKLTLPEPGTHEQLEQLVSTLMSTPLDMKKPLWQSHLIEGAQEGSVLLTRMHHCIADGQGTVRMVLSLTEPKENCDAKEALHGKHNPHHQQEQHKQASSNLWKLLLFPLMIIHIIWQFIHITVRMIRFSCFCKGISQSTQVSDKEESIVDTDQFG